MVKMSISEASEYFNVSKEAIHNRIRRGSLKSVMQNGVKLVLIDKENSNKHSQKVVKNAQHSDRYYKFLEEQNTLLQQKVEKLENETRDLRDQKEQLLIEERKKIEQIYKEKDEQLKSILNAISTKFLPQNTIKEDEHVEVEIEQKPDEIISLKKYLKTLKLSDKKREKIKKRFKKLSKKDERITTIGSKYYLNLTRYNYEDIVK